MVIKEMDRMKELAKTYLRKSEKYLKTDMVYLAHGGFWLTFGHSITSIAALLLAIAFANFVSQEVYGMYKYVVTVATLLVAFSLTGTSTSLVKAVAHGKDGTLAHLFKKNIQWSLLVFLGGAVLGGYYFIQGNLVLATGMLLAGCLSPFIESASLYSPFLNGQKKFRVNALYNSIRAVIPAFIIALTIWYTSDIYWILGAYFVSHAIVSFALYRRVKRVHSRNEEIDTTTLSYSKHLSFINILGKFADAFDKILTFHFLGATQLAVYTFAVLVPKEFMRLNKKVAHLALPKFAQRSVLELKSTVIRKTLLFSLLLVPFALLYYFLAPTIFSVLFPQYMESVPLTQIFIFAVIAANYIPTAVFESQRALKENYIIQIFSSIIRIVFMTALFFPFGLLGLIVGRIASRFTIYILGIILITRMK